MSIAPHPGREQACARFRLTEEPATAGGNANALGHGHWLEGPITASLVCGVSSMGQCIFGHLKDQHSPDVPNLIFGHFTFTTLESWAHKHGKSLRTRATRQCLTYKTLAYGANRIDLPYGSAAITFLP